LTGYVEIEVEGFFIERFINICRSKNIFLWDLKRDKNTIIKMKIGLSDFKKIRQMAKKTKSRLKIKKKSGMPFLLHRYRKRKIFAITLLVIAILIYILTRYIWNIEINGLESIKKDELLTQLNESGIVIGTKISKVSLEFSF
jgi:similar to stage IV sporulation protein